MPLSSRTLTEIEKAHPDGLSSKEIIQVLGDNGEPLSEATLRKYVQMGLLPRSRRVGQKGKHRGSRGIYPVEVIRRVDEIRRAMDQGDTLDELARASQAVRAKVSSLRVAMEEVLEAAETDFSERALDRTSKSQMRSELAALKRSSKDWVKSLDRWMSALEQAEKATQKAAASSANGRTPTRQSKSKRPARLARGGK